MTAQNLTNSSSSKIADARCPAGKRVIGTAAIVVMNDRDFIPNQVQEVSVGTEPLFGDLVRAYGTETQPTDREWRVVAYAFCATVAG